VDCHHATASATHSSAPTHASRVVATTPHVLHSLWLSYWRLLHEKQLDERIEAVLLSSELRDQAIRDLQSADAPSTHTPPRLHSSTWHVAGE
jgi:hypothetical protein